MMLNSEFGILNSEMVRCSLGGPELGWSGGNSELRIPNSELFVRRAEP